jgi:DNA helicase-4
MDSGFCGFPSEITNDPLLDMVLPPQRDPLEEERRLLYVGLTRSRRQTILLVAATRPSEYVLELEQLHELQDRIEWQTLGIERHICPRCRRGTMQPKWKADKPHRCSRHPKCGYSIMQL